LKIPETNLVLGSRGEEVVKSWLSQHSHEYIPVEFLRWEDSKMSFEEFRRYWDNERQQYFGERGILTYQQNVENYQRYGKDYEYRFQRTRDFFKEKRREE
jgi:hypothetical protein